MNCSTRTDDELLSEVKAGSEDALGVLIDRYSAYVLAIVRRMIKGRLSAQDAEAITTEAFYAAIGTEPFGELMPSYEPQYPLSAGVYEDGSFALNGTGYEPEGLGKALCLNIYREMRGVVPTAFLFDANDPESFDVMRYRTMCGEYVDLALGKEHSFVFAELCGCWVTLDVSGGYADNPDTPSDPGEALGYRAVITMEMLKEIADVIDFTKLEA